MCREIVENVLSGTKARFKATRNLVFNQKAERSTMNRQKSREIVENVLSGTKAGFKAILNFEHSIERKKMFNQKSKSTFSATLLALILGASVFMAGQVWAAKYVTDPTTGKVVTAPEYGGTLTFPAKEEQMVADTVVYGPTGAPSGILEKLAIADWATPRDKFDFIFLNPPTNTRGLLAESWSQPDPLTIIIKVRQGVNWHNKAPMNGRELTAQDIEYNFHRVSGTGSGFTERSEWSLVDWEGVHFESITATDKWTVVFKLKELSLSTLRLILNHWLAYIYPPEVIKEHGDATDWRNLVGTGPFFWTDWTEGSSVTWEKNPDYWGFDEKYPENRLPYVDKIRALVMPEVATYMAALRTGKLDYIGPILQTQMKTLDQMESLQRTNPELVILPYGQRSDNVYGMDVQSPPFDDIRVRKAMQMAINLDEINNAYYKGYADTIPQGMLSRTMTEMVTQFEDWPEDVKKVFDYDPEGAEALLDEAGYPRGADGIRFKTEMLFLTRFDLNFTEFVASYWNKIGVDVEIAALPITPWVARKRARDFKMSSAAGAARWFPMPYLGGFLTEAGFPLSIVSDPDYDALSEAAGAATTNEEQNRIYRDMNQYVIEKFWAIWATSGPEYQATQPWLTGFNGEFMMGNGQTLEVFARLWIDSELKKKMGH